MYLGNCEVRSSGKEEPTGWLRAIDEALVSAHLGVANCGDSYETAKAKLATLIDWHIDVASDPAVNDEAVSKALETLKKAATDRNCSNCDIPYQDESEICFSCGDDFTEWVPNDTLRVVKRVITELQKW